MICSGLNKNLAFSDKLMKVLGYNSVDINRWHIVLSDGYYLFFLNLGSFLVLISSPWIALSTNLNYYY